MQTHVEAEAMRMAADLLNSSQVPGSGRVLLLQYIWAWSQLDSHENSRKILKDSNNTTAVHHCLWM